MRLGDAAAVLPVQPDRVHLVQVGHGAVALGEVADLRDRAEVAIHRIDRLERDQLRRRRVAVGEQRLEMRDVIVPEDALVAARMADAGDHRGVILLIRIDHAAGQQTTDGGQRRLVGDEAGGEQERRGFAVQARQLALEQHVQVCGAGDVARAAGAGAHPVHRLDRSVQDHGMLAHAQVVVGAPHGDGIRLGVGMDIATGARKRARLTRQIAEHAVAAFAPDPIDRTLKDVLIVHHPPPAGAVMAFAQTACASPSRSRAHAIIKSPASQADADGTSMTVSERPSASNLGPSQFSQRRATRDDPWATPGHTLPRTFGQGL